MLQQDQPDDYVVATGRSATIREFCRLAFAVAGLNYEDHVVQNPVFLRPAEVDYLRGDAAKARARLGWAPETSLEALAEEMVAADLARLRG